MDRLAKVLTVSQRAAAGERADTSGPAVAGLLSEHGFAVVERAIVPDGEEAVRQALAAMVQGFHGVVVTTGGSGFSPDDMTPEATAAVAQREAPGLAGAMRAASPMGRLSRGRAGIAGRAIVLNVPGSASGAREQLSAVVDVLGHALELVGGGRPH